MEKCKLEMVVKSQANELKAIVSNNPRAKHYDLVYKHDNGQEYSIEIPKTDKNAHLKDGQEIFVFLAIATMEVE